MKHLFNIIRFIIYLPLSLGLLYGIYFLIGIILVWFLSLSTFWLVVITLFFLYMIIGLVPLIIAYIAPFISMINPYKKAGNYVLIPIAIIYLLFTVCMTWKVADLSYTRGFLLAIVGSAAYIYATNSFCMFISSNMGENMLLNKL